MNGHRKSLPPNKEHLEFRISNFFLQPPEFSGKNTFFHNKASFFLLSDDNTIVTNNKNLRPFSFYSNKPCPNKKFIFSNFISGIFKFLNLHRLDKYIKDKYFTCIRRHLLITAAAIKTRLSSSASNNNQTRTFFRFSIGRNTYYFGIYVPCQHSSCSVPPTHVTKHGPRCWIHWRNLCRQLTPRPPLHCSEFPTKPKRIKSLRLGVSYTKDFVHIPFSRTYLVTYTDLHRFSFQPQCLKRFERLIRSPYSNNRSFLLHKTNYTVHRRCKHLPGVPSEIDLTQFVQSHPDLIDDDDDEVFFDAQESFDDTIEIDLSQLANSYFNLD